MTELNGRTVLLTGASGGIGRQLAEALADGGANVVLSGRREGALAEVAQTVEQRGVKAAVVPADLADFDAIDALVDRAEAALGPLDIVVHNAGIEYFAPFADLTRDELTSLVDVNLTSPMLLTQRVLPGMVERGRGHVVFMASSAGHLSPAYAAPYDATKAGLISLSRSLRAEYAGSPVSFSVVSPGFVVGDGMSQRMLDGGVNFPRLLGRTSTERVADAVVRAIHRDSVEIIITGSPARPLVALGAIAPKTHERMVRLVGMHGVFQRVARIRGRLE